MADLTWFVAVSDPSVAAAVTDLRHALDAAGLRDAGDLGAATPPGGTPRALVVWTDRPLDPAAAAAMGAGGPVVLAGPTVDAAGPAVLEAAGLTVAGSASPPHDVRVRSGPDGGHLDGHLVDHSHVGGAHLGHHTHVRDRVLPLVPTADDVRVLLAARLGLVDHPLATWRPSSGVLVWTPGTTDAAVRARGTTRLLAVALRQVLGLAAPAPVRVGLLGYGAIGHEHAQAVRAVTGLELTAVCDTSDERLAAAATYSPGVRTTAAADDLLAADDVDLLVVSTPPASHARWAQAALTAGKHVVVEKPFAITTAEADKVLALAGEHGLLAMVYQNRRFDPDHLAIRRAADTGRLGEIFHLEAFVGGYGHPCNLWHSDAAVSGGAFYDWGAHVLDQVLDLIREPVVHVTAAEHKRVWLDVTNADHSRVTLRFASGAEATFVYSDLAAALKPRWYVLGTAGAVVGSWRSERVIARSDIGTLAEDVLAPADSPPQLDLHAADGSVTRLTTPPGAPHAFHAELADAVRFGLPTTVTGEQSRRVLAVMEAAVRSAADGGRPVCPR